MLKKLKYLLLLALPNIAQAAGPFSSSDFTDKFGLASGSVEPETLAIRVINVFLYITGAAGLISFIYYGILLTTSRGEEPVVQKAKQGLVWSIVGIVVVGIALLLIYASKSAATPQPGSTGL